VFIATTAFAAPSLGVASTITLLVLGQLIASVLIDHFGAFGVAPRPVGWERLLGVVLVLAGVVLVRRS
jgi:transporter family-2 protein